MLRKISVLTAMVLFTATAAFAASATSVDMGTSALTAAATGKSLYGAKTGVTASASTPLIGKTSTGVGIGVFLAAGGYAITTVHMNGTKQFGTSYDSTSIFSKDLTTKGTPILGVPTAITTTNFSSWSSM